MALYVEMRLRSQYLLIEPFSLRDHAAYLPLVLTMATIGRRFIKDFTFTHRQLRTIIVPDDCDETRLYLSFLCKMSTQ